MGFIILLVLIGLPAAEIWVFNKVGSILGFWDTFFLVIFSAFFGVYLAQLQGKAVLQKVQQCLAEGRVPTSEMLDGILVFIGGILFVIPGFITDGIGLMLIFPPTRWLIKLLISKRVMAGFVARQSAGSPFGFRFRDDEPSPSSQRPTQEIPRPRGPVQDAEIIEPGKS
ncbi:MAG: FxsA family protein [Candidatus Omnitrophica bacterium]|nr:FxsA family protein [Candidatus Omnitrophota bacterium]